jgi:transcriptional regulator with XRE-family HTH domain
MSELKAEILGELIRFIRWLRNWNQAKLSRESGIGKSQISRYEAGLETPGPAVFQQIAAAGGVPLRLMGFIWSCLQLIRSAIAAETANEAKPGNPAAGSEETHAAVAQAVDRALALARAELALLRSTARSGPPHPPSAEDLSRAEALVKKLRNSSKEKRRLLIEGGPSFRSWVVCLRLCAASEAAAANDPVEARELAELAVFIAPQVPGDEAWRARLEGYCTGYIANSQKVSNELRLADATLARAWRRWKAGKDERSLLSEARLLDLEASLRWAERKFPQALKLHDQALAVAWPEERGHLLLNKSAALEQKGDYEGSLAVLEQAAHEIDGRRQPRLLCVLKFNQAANLLRLGRASEAAPIVYEVRKLADTLKNDLDKVRTLWLEGNLFAGLGQHEEAAAALEQVRRAFEERKLPYDYALACLDLALVFRAAGRLADVQRLAAEMVEIFQAFQVQREAIAAALTFRDAALQGAVTETLVRRLQEYFPKVRANPKLRFEG